MSKLSKTDTASGLSPVLLNLGRVDFRQGYDPCSGRPSFAVSPRYQICTTKLAQGEGLEPTEWSEPHLVNSQVRYQLRFTLEQCKKIATFFLHKLGSPGGARTPNISVNSRTLCH